MNTPDDKPIKKTVLNSKLLPIAALVLIVLALLFMATPLLRPTRGFQRSGNFVPQGNGQTIPQNGFPGQGSRPQGLPDQGGSNFPNRQFAFRGVSFLGGITGAIVFFAALLASLVAAVGMFLIKRWGQVLGLIMAVLYLFAGLVSLLPILFMGFVSIRNPLSLILGIAHILLALAVIVLALIPAKKLITPALAVEPPPAASS